MASPGLPWKVRILTFALGLLIDVRRRSHSTFNRSLTNLFNLKAPPLLKPVDGGLQSSDVVIDHSRDLWFRLYYTNPVLLQQHDGLPVVVYFHGGGFVLMSADSKIYDDFCCRLARELHAVVVSVNYRLAPDHRCPSQYDDGFDVLRFIDGEGRLPVHADLKRCFLAGDSAGGNIAHHVAVKAADHEFCHLNVAGVVGIQSFFGGEERTESETRPVQAASVLNLDRTDWMWRTFLPDGSDRDHPAVNVCGPGSLDISGLKRFPATMVVVGGLDPLRDWQKSYWEWLKKLGKEAHLIEYPNAIHFFYAFPELKESSLLIKDMRDFIHLNKM